ncbi:hypothetical protein NQ315_009209 [Exocentrus adspersus]|uniref:NADH dehydrogenase [ubiquinone] 1 beta subcomplex subunit 3 n=1 Tax=Exocentrus adspersus TaxID=1586481 RepID=A0AAV8WG19_9CUCU|nr:hypothetical protein NQ315_009209 [Exocentrus adspersus]
MYSVVLFVSRVVKHQGCRVEFRRKMGGHGHGHKEPFTVPDYRIYKVSDIPELVVIEKALEYGVMIPSYGAQKAAVLNCFFRGFKYGFGAFLITIAGTALYDKMYPSEHGHGDHGHGSKH